jgi:hypothetical protein
MRCVEDDRDKRPSITGIRDALKELDTKIEAMLKENPKQLIPKMVQYIYALHTYSYMF